jgi:thiosulfate oxidation carrier complex protein SoxZ
MGSRGFTRRELVAGSCAGTAALALTPRSVLARPRDVEYAIKQLYPGAEVGAGKVFVDLPSHSDTGTSVPLTVGLERDGAAADIPRAIHVFADGNPRPNIVSAWFTPRCGRPELSTRIRLESAQTVTAVAEMPDGSVWRADKDLTVNFGACADVGSGTPAEIREFKPVSRVSVPKKAAKGEVITIRALISHPMETGLRLDAFNLWVPLRIIEEFNCSFDGEQILKIRPYPAIATNPYFSFFARAEESGVFAFSWVDTDGSVYTNTARIEVD